MKLLKIISAVLVTVVLVLVATVSMNWAGTGAEVNIEITKKTSQAEIETMVDQLEKKGVKLEITSLTYNEEAEIEAIEGKIWMKNGESGSFSSGEDFNLVRISGGFGLFLYQGIKIEVR